MKIYCSLQKFTSDLEKLIECSASTVSEVLSNPFFFVLYQELICLFLLLASTNELISTPKIMVF